MPRVVTNQTLSLALNKNHETSLKFWIKLSVSPAFWLKNLLLT